MTQHPLLRVGSVLLAAGLGCAGLAAGAPPATAAGSPPPPVCARPAQVRSTALPADDNAAAQAANKARVADLQARHPDRRLSPYSRLNEVGEGWRYGWQGGRRQYVTFLNRQGAMLVGTAFAPDPARCPGRRPVVLVSEGITANEVLYWWQAQSLAEAGYVVLTFDDMNQGLSEATGHAADGTAVPAVGGARGPDPATGFLQDAQDALDFLLSTPSRPYRHTGPRLVTDAPFDSAFPFAAQVDPRHVGLTGHSEGARVVSVLQGIDRRVGAVVALDNLASRLKGDQGSSNSQCVDGGIGTDTTPTTPRVPALGQAAPNNAACGDPELKKTAYERWRAAGVPAVQVVLAGAQHGDWAPSPAGVEGDRDVPELAAFWTVAWFDRWLLRDPSAELRVLTRSFELFDHYTGPFRRSAAEVFDTSFTSSAATGTNSCPDLRAGCAAVAPALATSGRGGTESGDPAPAPDDQEPPGDEAPAGVRAALALGQPPAVPPAALPETAPVPPASVEAAPFVPAEAAVSTPGAPGLVALPATGVVLGLLVLVGFRRHEGRARRLGAVAR